MPAGCILHARITDGRPPSGMVFRDFRKLVKMWILIDSGGSPDVPGKLYKNSETTVCTVFTISENPEADTPTVDGQV